MTRRETQDRWRALVSEQAASGLGAAAWCRVRGVDYPAFMRWRRRLGETALVGDGGGFVELMAVGLPPHMPQPGSVAGGGVLRMDFGHGCGVDVGPGVDDVTLRRVLSALRECWR